jgi:hypothetical protein
MQADAGDEDIYGDTNMPNLGEAGTTASEFDGAFDVAGDDDENEDNGSVDDESNDDASADEPKHQKSAKTVCI